MLVGQLFKKFWWVILLLIYIAVLIYRVCTVVPSSGFTLPEISLVIAILQTIIQNFDPVKKLINRIYFALFHVEIRWKYTAEFTVAKEDMIEFSKEHLKKIIQEVVSKNEDLKHLKDDIKPYKSENGMEIVINFMPLGINLYFKKRYGDFSDELGIDNDERLVNLKIVGDSLIKYGDTKAVLDKFMTGLFSKVEEELKNVYHKHFILTVESVGNDTKVFKKLFLKGIVSAEADSFSVQRKCSTYTMHASENRIYISSENREDLVQTTKNILFKYMF